MSVAVVTDSTAYLPEALTRAHAVHVVPLHVVVGGVQHEEGVDISTAQLASALRQFRPVSTSRPSPAAFLTAYEAAAAAGANAVVSVHISSSMSGTVDSAAIAATECSLPVEVVDSRSMGMAMGYAVLSAAEAAGRGVDAKDVAAVARRRAAESSAVFYVDTLEYLRRGGRIGAASRLLGSALAIKPLLELRDGQIQPVEKVRTAARALSRLEELASGATHSLSAERRVDVAVQHLDAHDRAGDLAERLRKRLRGRLADSGDVLLVELGAVVGAHVGPGTIAVVVSPRPLEDSGR